jgi:hypothetical protein
MKQLHYLVVYGREPDGRLIEVSRDIDPVACERVLLTISAEVA